MQELIEVMKNEMEYLLYVDGSTETSTTYMTSVEETVESLSRSSVHVVVSVPLLKIEERRRVAAVCVVLRIGVKDPVRFFMKKRNESKSNQHSYLHFTIRVRYVSGMTQVKQPKKILHQDSSQKSNEQQQYQRHQRRHQSHTR